MADDNPGQVFGPQQDSSDPTRSSGVQSPEVSVPLSRNPAPDQPIAQPSVAPAPPPQMPTMPAPEARPSAYSLADSQPAPVSPYALNDQVVPYSEPIPADPPAPSLEPITWTASEYIAHHKEPSWYLALAGASLVAIVIVYFVTGGDFVSAVSVALVAIVFGVYAARKPQEREYTLSADGISIAGRLYPMDTLKSFSITTEGPFRCINFVSLKRFALVPSIYYDPADEERIATFLLNFLPLEEPKHDPFDRITNKLKF